MRNLLVCLALTASTSACTSADGAKDLGSFTTGKTDVQGIKLPLRLGEGESLAFLLDADGPFEMSTRYDQPAEIDLVAVDGAGMTFHTAGTQPTLLVDGVAGSPASYELTVKNPTTIAVSGTLEIRNPRAVCADGAWTGWFDTVVQKLADVGSVIDVQERAGIDAIIAARPCVTTSDAAYAAWLTQFAARLTESGSVFDSNEQVFIDILLGLRPAATGEAAYAAWQAVFATLMIDVGSVIDSNEQVRVDVVRSIRPLTVSDNAYVAWSSAFEPVLVDVGSIIDTNERALLDTWTSVKPCATGAAALAAWNELAAAAPNGAGAVLTAAHPTSGCQ